MRIEPRPLAEGIDPWERQPGESRWAYAAFAIYRDMGPVARSIAKVARQAGRSGSLRRRWSTRWQWVFRSEQFDANEERLRRDAMRASQTVMLNDFRMIGHAGLMLAARMLPIIEDPALLRPRDLAPLVLAFARLECIGHGIDFGQVRDGAQGRAPEGAAASIIASAEWIDLRARLLEALRPYPSARVAAAQALLGRAGDEPTGDEPAPT